MPVGSLLGALGLVALVHAEHPAAYLAVWMLLGVAIAASLYDSGLCHARAHFRRSGAAADHRAHARRRLRLDRELAGDLSADRTGRLARHLSRLRRSAGAGRSAPACLRCCRAAAPKHRRRPTGRRRSRVRCCRPHGWAFAMVAAAFAAYAFVPSALSAHLLGDLRPLRPRRRHRGGDRHVVRAVAGCGTHLRAAVRAQCASAGDRAAGGRAPSRRFCAHGRRRCVGAGRCAVHGAVRDGERSDHHCARDSAARAVRTASATARSSAASPVLRW